MNKLKSHATVWLWLTVLAGILSACIEDNNTSTVRTYDCSVILRCTDDANLSIRLLQVQTSFYEDEDADVTSSRDIADFDYNDKGQWIGGITRRAIESDIAYTIEYSEDGKVSFVTKVFVDDNDDSAKVELDYEYIDDVLDRTLSATLVRDENNNVLKTIDEIFDYTFIGGDLMEINFDVSDSDPLIGDYNFLLEFTYVSGNITQIEKTQQSSGQPDFVFKSFDYDESGKLIISTTNRLNNSNEQVVLETATYQYYQDGPIKFKTALTNSTPKQKIETLYRWESGECNSNQVFVDRLYPTPEISNLPCL
jgi:antitoxin component YwqK of YwqJK toxin-antitoxin module